MRGPPVFSCFTSNISELPSGTQSSLCGSVVWFRLSLFTSLVFFFLPWAASPAHFSSYCFIFTVWCHDKVWARTACVCCLRVASPRHPSLLSSHKLRNERKREDGLNWCRDEFWKHREMKWGEWQIKKKKRGTRRMLERGREDTAGPFFIGRDSDLGDR